MMAETLQVPGATLYYELRGTGPLLLLIPGGNGDAGPYERLANGLVDRYTVVSYDRRGFSRSPLSSPAENARRIETDSADAHHLLTRLADQADGPAYVFGSSSGAIVALDLIVRHPDQIHTLVVHEPPAVTLLPDAEQVLEFLEQVYDTYRNSGVDSAMQKFNAGVGMDNMQLPPGVELPPQLTAMMSRIQGNMAFWLECEIRQYPRFVPDVAALKSVSARLVLAGGCDSREQFPYRPNLVLAEQIGSQVVDFPGGHVGYVTHPVEFAEKLCEVLPRP